MATARYRVSRRYQGQWIVKCDVQLRDLANEVLWTARCYPGDIKVEDVDTGNIVIGTAREMAGIAEVLRIAKLNGFSPLDRAGVTA